MSRKTNAATPAMSEVAATNGAWRVVRADVSAPSASLTAARTRSAVSGSASRDRHEAAHNVPGATGTAGLALLVPLVLRGQTHSLSENRTVELEARASAVAAELGRIDGTTKVEAVATSALPGGGSAPVTALRW